MHLGRLDEALERQLASLRHFDEIGDGDGCAECVEGLAMLANAHGAWLPAARLFGLATLLRDNAGTQSPAAQRLEVEREREVTRTALGDAAYEAAWQTGRGLSVDEAVALAEAVASVGSRP
jgi:hypothetical protein